MYYTHRMVDGERVELTAAEIAELEQRDRDWEASKARPKPTATEKVAKLAKQLDMTVEELKAALK